MKTIEEKAQTYAEGIFAEMVNKYQNAPWNEFMDALAQIYTAGVTEALAEQWRSVEDELPKPEQDVFVAVAWGDDYSYGYAWLSTLSNGTLRWYSHDDYLHLDNIRYWMPIPDPPKSESNINTLKF